MMMMIILELVFGYLVRVKLNCLPDYTEVFTTFTTPI